MVLIIRVFMKEERLRYLAEINRQHSISAAAKNLFLSQASLSSTLRETEKELGFPVFERTHTGVQPTQEGAEALRLIDEINEYVGQIRALGEQDPAQTRRASLIVSPSIAYGTLLPLTDLYRRRQPDGLLSFQIKSGEFVVSSIIKNDFSIGLTYMKDDELVETSRLCSRFQLQIEQLMLDRLFFLMRKDSPLSQEESIIASRLKGFDFALLPHFNSSENAAFYVEFMNSANTYTVFPSVAHQKSAVRNKNMIAVLPGFPLNYDKIRSNDVFTSRPVSGLSYRGDLHLCLVYRNELGLNEQEKCLIECIGEYFRQ